MSYCRWSSDNFCCDLYVYESVQGGWETHVAGRRVVGSVPKIDMSSEKAFLESHHKQSEFMKTAERVDIGLPQDGASFTDYSLNELRARLIWLRELGYNFPDSVLECVEEEMREK